jgi:hypothetical protein
MQIIKGQINMNVGWNIESYLTIISFIVTVVLSTIIVKINWRQYGLLYILNGITGVILCYLFIAFDLYYFPYRILPDISKIPFTVILTVFPFYTLIGVRYSPVSWAFKIPFYWFLVHIGVFTEVLMENNTQLIKYNLYWDVWDSYTWWWLFLLVFEWIGGIIVSPEFKKPLKAENFNYGKLGWFILHFVLIITIFLAGYYMGKVT